MPSVTPIDGETALEPPEGPARLSNPQPARPASGLAVGALAPAFNAVHVGSLAACCGRCEPQPVVLAMGAADDPAFARDLQDLDALAAKYGADAFAPVGVLLPASLHTPSDPTAWAETLGALPGRLRIGMPLVVPVAHEADAFERAYNLTQSRTMLVVNAQGNVVLHMFAPSDWSALATMMEQPAALRH